MPLLYPLRFEPFLRPMPWGGRRLASWFGRELSSEQRIGEAWLLSDHSLHQSVVADGPLAGVSLRQLMAEHRHELLGETVESPDRFPLLIKLLDARENLSVQVHPDDDLAQRWAPGEGGKTEAWYVLEADADAAIYLGLKPGIDEKAFARELTRGVGHLCLRRYDPRPGECYFVPAGTVHALGGGLVVLEVQQTSDATFRLYDWGRTDAAGRPRPLHLEAGLACVRAGPGFGAGLQAGPVSAQGVIPVVSCEHFAIRLIRGPWQGELPTPTIVIGLRGAAHAGSADDAELRSGELLLMPASLEMAVLELSPDAEAVVVSPAATSDGS